MLKCGVQFESIILFSQVRAMLSLVFGFTFLSVEFAPAGELIGRFMSGSTAVKASGFLEEPVIASLFPVGENADEGVGSLNASDEMHGAVREVKIRNGQFSSSVILTGPNDRIQIRNLDQEAKLLNCYAGNELKQSVFLPQRGSFIRISQRATMDKMTRWVDTTSGRSMWVQQTRSPWVNICSKTGEFRWEHVPEGLYRLTIEKRNQGLIERTLSVSSESRHGFAFRLGANGLAWIDSEIKQNVQ